MFQTFHGFHLVLLEAGQSKLLGKHNAENSFIWESRLKTISYLTSLTFLFPEDIKANLASSRSNKNFFMLTGFWQT